MPASSAASGSSRRSNRGSVTSARAERDPLLLATRERAGSRPRTIREPKPFEPFARTSARLGPRQAATAQAERHVLEDVHRREQQVVLEHEPHAAPLRNHERVGVGIVEHHAVDPDRTALERHQSGERATTWSTFPRRSARAPRPSCRRARRARPAGRAGRAGHRDQRSASRSPPNQWSRNETSTTTDTASSARLSAMATSWLLSSSR